MRRKINRPYMKKTTTRPFISCILYGHLWNSKSLFIDTCGRCGLTKRKELKQNDNN